MTIPRPVQRRANRVGSTNQQRADDEPMPIRHETT
jgi:hypothetical protein